MKLRHRRRGTLSDRPLMTFINVIFLLLIFFLLAGNLQPLRTLPVTLPKTAAGHDTVLPGVTLTVTRSGALAWNGEPVTLTALRRRAADLPHDRPSRPVVWLIADRELALPALGPLLAALRAAGVTQVHWVSEAR